MNPFKRPFKKSDYHERFIRDRERCLCTMSVCGSEPEPCGIFRMTNNDQDAVPETPAGCKPFFDKERANASVMELRKHRHRGKSKGRNTAFSRFPESIVPLCFF